MNHPDSQSNDLETGTPAIPDDMNFFDHLGKALGTKIITDDINKNYAVMPGTRGFKEVLAFMITALRNLPFDNTTECSTFIAPYAQEKIRAIADYLERTNILKSDTLWHDPSETLVDPLRTQLPLDIYTRVYHPTKHSKPTICYKIDIGAMPIGGDFASEEEWIMSDVVLRRFIAGHNAHDRFIVQQAGELRLSLFVGRIGILPVANEAQNPLITR